MSNRTLAPRSLTAAVNAWIRHGARFGAGAAAVLPALAMANPTGGTVAAGSATISNPNPNATVVKQTSQGAIINWQQFNVGASQYVQFLQPSSSSVILNRVIGGSPSSILGSISANGQVFLVNANGVFFGNGASIDAQGFLASTLGISDANFMSGNYLFDEPGAAGAQVVNQGSISSRNGGYVVLAGDYTQNTGVITAESGHVVLASGTKTVLTLDGDKFVSFAVDQATLAAYAGVANSGEIIADGGTIVMTADVANALKATVVNNSGLIEAHSISKSGGTILLAATGGDVENSGTLDASATTAGLAGGKIVLQTDEVTNLTSASKIYAAGDGATGGNLELSGETIHVRGTAKLGKGGNLLLDPGTMSIVAGSASTPGLPSSNMIVGKIGLNYIEGRLNSGANVFIQAQKLIQASAGITDITATGTGNLGLNINAGSGRIKLHGTNITIGGAFTASVDSYGHGSFGYIQAKSITLNVNGSHGGFALHQASASASGKVNRYSLLATNGDVDITAASVTGTGGLTAIKATGGNVNIAADLGEASSHFDGGVKLIGKNVTAAGIHANGSLQVSASAGALNVGAVSASKSIALTAKAGTLTAGRITAGKNVSIHDAVGNMTLGIVQAGSSAVIADSGHILNFASSDTLVPTAQASRLLTITAKTIEHAGSNFSLSAGHGIDINGELSFTGTHQNLILKTQGTIAIEQSLKVPGDITIEGSQLIVGKAGATVSISAEKGSLDLDASIGSLAAPVKYNLNLIDKLGSDILIKKSIYIGATPGKLPGNLTVTEAGVDAAGHSVYIGNDSGSSLTMQVAGAITIKGWNVGIGAVNSSHTYGAVTIKAAKGIAVTATGGTGTPSGGNLDIVAENASASYNSKNTSVLLQAGGNLTLTGKYIDVHAGNAQLYASGSASDEVQANVTLKAAGNISLIGRQSTGFVRLAAGNASASGELMSGGDNKVTALADVALDAGKLITLSGHEVEVSGGKGVAKAYAASTESKVTAEAEANIALTAGTGITLTVDTTNSGGISIHGGYHVGYAGRAFAADTSDSATAISQGEVTFTTGGAITMIGRDVHISGGNDAGAGAPYAASANKGKASYAADAGVSLTAGAAGISITASGIGDSIVLLGGSSVGGQVHAAAYGGGIADADIVSNVALSTTGNISLLSTRYVQVMGGSDALESAAASAAGNTAGAIAEISGDASVSLSGAAITIGGNKTATIFLQGGAYAGEAMAATAHDGKTASVSVLAGVKLVATAGMVLDGGSVGIRGGYAAGGSAKAEADIGSGASGGKASATANAAISMTAGALSVTAAGGAVVIVGGSEAGSLAAVRGSHAAASVNAAAGVGITATSVKISATAGVASIVGGDLGAWLGKASEQSGHATLDADAGVSIVARTGALSVTAKNGLFIVGGQKEAAGSVQSSSTSRSLHGATAKADGAGSAAITGSGSVSLTAHTAMTLHQTATSGNLGIQAGSSAGAVARALASAGGDASVSGKAGVNLKAGTALSITGGRVKILGRRYTAEGGGSSIRGVFSISGGVTPSFTKVPTQATGANSKAEVAGDAGVVLTAGTVALTGVTSGSVVVIGGSDGVNMSQVEAHGGKASVAANDGVTITATGAFTATAGKVQIGGHGDSAQHVFTSASGSTASALVKATGGVSITAAKANLTGVNSIEIFSGSAGAKAAQVYALNGGTAGVTAKMGTSITAVSSFSALLTGADVNGGQILIQGGNSEAAIASVTASDGGHANVDVASGISITVTKAGGAITMETGKNNHSSIFIDAGNQDGASAGATANNGGSASVNVDESLNISAPGAITLEANHGNFFVYTGTDDGHQGFAHESNGGKATVTVGNALGITGGTLTLVTGTYTNGTAVSDGRIRIAGGLRGAANSADVDAHYFGSASFNVGNGITLSAATGALKIKSAGNLSISGGTSSAAVRTSVTAGQAAKAALSYNDETQISGHAGISLTAGTNLFLTPGAANVVGSSDHANASFGGDASIMDDLSMSIVTPGALTVKAGKELALIGLSNANFLGAASAHNGDAVANNSAIGTISINAKTATLSAGTLVQVLGGVYAGSSAHAHAYNGGTAIMAGDGSINITAANSISIKVLDKGGEMEIEGGDEAAWQASASAGSKGHATVTGTANVDLVVTGATGTITLGSANHASEDIVVRGGLKAGSGALAMGNFAGSAQITGSAGVALVAKTVAVNAGANGNISFMGGVDSGKRARIIASDGQAALTTKTQVSVTAATVSLAAGDNIVIAGSGAKMGSGASLKANSGGYAGFNGTAGVSISASGTLAVAAGENLTVSANSRGSGNASIGRGAILEDGSHGAASGGRTTFTATNDVDLSAVTVALTAAKGSLLVKAGNNAASAALLLVGSHEGKASMAVDQSVNINATGAVALVAGGTLEVLGGQSAGREAILTDGTSLTQASLKAKEDVSISAGGALSAKATGQMVFTAGNMAGASQHVFAGSSGRTLGSDAATVGITAASIKLTTASTLSITGGGSGGHDAEIFALKNAVGTLDVADGVGISATGAIAVKQSGGNLSIAANGNGASAGFSASRVNAAANFSVAGAVDIKAGTTLAFAGADNVSITGGPITSVPTLNAAAGGKTTAAIDTSVTLAGTSIKVAHTGTLTSNSDSFSSGGLKINSTVNFNVIVPPLSFSPAAIGVRTLSVDDYGLLAAPDAVDLDGAKTGMKASSSESALGSLNVDGIVVNLVTVAAADLGGEKPDALRK